MRTASLENTPQQSTVSISWLGVSDQETAALNSFELYDFTRFKFGKHLTKQEMTQTRFGQKVPCGSRQP
jgi:hypothetical protein